MHVENKYPKYFPARMQKIIVWNVTICYNFQIPLKKVIVALFIFLFHSPELILWSLTVHNPG